MQKTFFFIFIICSINSYAQKDLTALTKPIVDEGKKLYKSEMASWYGTDLFLENYKDQSKIGGYFSYTENEFSKCLFYSKDNTPKVLGTITFDSTYNTKTAKKDFEERNFTTNENNLYQIRENALEIINKDTFFKQYKNTNLNLIPLINGNEKKLYILTGPTNDGVVILGNDYLLNFDANNNLISKKQLHKNIIPIEYGNEDGKEIEGSMHSHLPETGDFITATDICTLMLYAKFTKWKQHSVVSKKYLSIWNCKENELFVMTMEAVEKINKDQEKRNKKNN